MKAKEVTREIFARWSHQRDIKAGCESIRRWERLPKDVQQAYLEEADYYLSQPVEDWPEDILIRLQS